MNFGVAQSIFSRGGVKLLGSLQQQLRVTPSKWLTTSTQLQSNPKTLDSESFWTKNDRLKRPMSPHLTIYKYQITSVLSITHRMTGLALAGMTSALAIGTLAAPDTFPVYMEWLSSQHFGAPVIFGMKFAIAWPFMFHFCNGLRHLAWDMGKGFEINQLYMSGYAVVATSIILATLLAFK